MRFEETQFSKGQTEKKKETRITNMIMRGRKFVQRTNAIHKRDQVNVTVFLKFLAMLIFTVTND